MENDDAKLQQAADAATSATSPTGRHDSGSSGGRYPQGDPPLAVDRPGVVAPESPQDPNCVDWRYLYSIVRARFDAERDRGRALDQKVGVLLAGAIAAVAFAYPNEPKGWWALILLTFLVPLIFLFDAFKTRLGKDAPKTKALANLFPYYPDATLRVAVSDMVVAEEFDRRLNDKKAQRADLAMLTLGVAFTLVLVAQVLWRGLTI